MMQNAGSPAFFATRPVSNAFLFAFFAALREISFSNFCLTQRRESRKVPQSKKISKTT
jgi:hypothetical protein